MKDADQSVSLVVPWRQVAVVTTLLATCALAEVVVLATVQDAGALNTVALALAVLAFVVQILVFIAQSWRSGQQAIQSQAINAQTLTALSEIRTRAAGTQDILAKQADSRLRVHGGRGGLGHAWQTVAPALLR